MTKRIIQDIAKQTEIHKPNTPLKNHLEFWQRTASEHCPQLGINLTDMKGTIQIPPKIISEIIIQAEDENYATMNKSLWDNSVASRDEIITDVNCGLEKDEIILAGKEMVQSLIIRATPGHAQSGHSTFFGKRKQNTCLEDVLDAIEGTLMKKFHGPKTRRYFQKTSQTYIDNIVYCMEDWLDFMKKNLNNIDQRSRIIQLKNRDGTPLNGFAPFDKTPIDILEGMRAFRFTTLMDNFPYIRKTFHHKYGHQLGGGESYLINTPKLKKYGIDISDLSKINFQGIFEFLNFIPSENRIKILTKLNIIKSKTLGLKEIIEGKCSWDEIKTNSGVVNLLENPNLSAQYIRSEHGLGVGDDISIYLASSLPQTYTKPRHIESVQARQSRIFLALLGDQIDTIEKGAELFMPGGQDETAGHHINGKFRELCKERKFREAFDIRYRKDGQYELLDIDTIIDFTGASANTKREYVHSSQRWFYKKVQDTCAISEYLRHLHSNTNIQYKETLRKDLQSFVNFDLTPSEEMKLTFRQVTLKKIKYIMDKRYTLIKNPSQREKRLQKFYSK